MDKENFNLLVKLIDGCITCKVCNRLNHICYFCFDTLTNVVEVEDQKEVYKSKYMKYANHIS